MHGKIKILYKIHREKINLSNVVFIGCPKSYGHFFPTLSIIAELIKCGEKVSYFTSENFKKYIESVGVEFCPYPDMGIYEHTKIELQQSDFFSRFITSCMHANEYYKNMEKATLLTLKNKRVDYILFDESAPWGKNIADALCVPSICSITKFAYCDKIFDKYKDIFLDKIFKIPKELYNKYQNYDVFINKLKKSLKIIGRQYNKNLEFKSYFSNSGAFNIVYTSKEFQIFGDDFDNTYSFIGPSISYRANKKSKPTNNRPLIYISFGTADYNIEIFEKCIKAFANKNYDILISTGNQFDNKVFRLLPKNILAYMFVDQISALIKADLFISHGGMNSTNEALLFKTPLLLFPQRGDQFLVSKRVEELKVGFNLKSENINSSELYDLAEHAIRDQFIQENCYDVGHSLSAAGGSKKGISEIIKFKNKFGIS